MKWTSRLGLFLLLSLAACGSSTSFPDPAPTDPAPPTALPELPNVREIDRDRDLLDDRLEDELERLRA